MDNFIDKLDSNSHPIGFDNGVCDLCKMEFRPARPVDFITQAVGYSYAAERDVETKTEVQEFWRSLLKCASTTWRIWVIRWRRRTAKACLWC